MLRKVFYYPADINGNFPGGYRFRPPKPEICPFCKLCGTLCLIRWGFYRVNGKRCLDYFPGILSFFFIQRFFCKVSGRTFSLLPDFLHSRKQYSQSFVGAVLETVLVSGATLYRVGQRFSLAYQTIQKWLRGFSSRREVKSICFAGYFKQDDFVNAGQRDYNYRFWFLLKEAFGRSFLVRATRLLGDGFSCQLY